MRNMTTVSTSLFFVSASVIQVRLSYAYGNANENWSFFHYANQLVPSLIDTFHNFTLSHQFSHSSRTSQARNGAGEAVCTARVLCQSIDAMDTPRIAQELLSSIDNVNEGDTVHFECRFSPINDSRLIVQW